MAIYTERKDVGPVEPEPCVRCRARPGTSWLDFLVNADAGPDEAGPRRAWLCAACRDAIQREAGGN